MNTNDYINRGEFNSVNAQSNFTADFAGWGKLNDETIKVNSQLSIEEILDNAGAMFNPLCATPKFYNPVTGQDEEDKDKKYILNGNTGEKLGLVGKDFNAMSHYETLKEGFGELMGRGNIPTKVINFDGGRKLMVTFFGGVQNIADRLHHKFIAMYNALDGTSRANFGGTDYCVVCANTFAASKREIKQSGYGAKHTENMGIKLAEIRKELGLVELQMTAYYTTLNQFATIKTDFALAMEFCAALIPDKKKEEGQRENDGPANRRNQLFQAINTSLAERNSSELTVYDIMQGLTRYTTFRQQKRNSEEQMEYVTSGPGATFSETGFNWLKNYADSR